MKKLAYFTAAFLIAYLTASALAQNLDVRFKGSIDTVNHCGITTHFADGGELTLMQCSALEAELADGGTWPLKVQTVEPSQGQSNNQAYNRCRRDLHRANRLDGGL